MGAGSAPAELMRDVPATDRHEPTYGSARPFGRMFYVVSAHHRIFLSLRTLCQRKGCLYKADCLVLSRAQLSVTNHACAIQFNEIEGLKRFGQLINVQLKQLE